eukprot:g10997.t1
MPGTLSSSPNKDPPGSATKKKDEDKKEKKDEAKKKDEDKKKKEEKKKQEEKKTPEQLLQEMRPKLEQEIDKANIKIAKTALSELINEILPTAIYFGCQEGRSVGDIPEIKQAAKEYFLKNKEKLEQIMKNPEAFIAETKRGHAADLITHLQSQTRAFPVKTQRDPEANMVSAAEQKTIDESNARARDFVSALMASLSHLVLFSDAAGEFEVKKCHDGTNLNKIARILNKTGVAYVRYMRILLLAYSRYVLKGKSPSVMAQAVQFFFGSTIRFSDMESAHTVATMMRAELIMTLDPKTQMEAQLFVEAAGVEIFQYTLVNTVQLFNKQAPLELNVLNAIVEGQDGKWPFPEQNSGAAGNIRYFDIFTTKKHESSQYQHRGFDLGIEQDQDMDEADESRELREKFAKLKLPLVFAFHVEEELEKKRQYEEQSSSSSDGSSEEEDDGEDDMGGAKPYTFGGFGAYKLNAPPKENKILHKKLTAPPKDPQEQKEKENEWADAEDGWYWSDEKQQETHWRREVHGKSGHVQWIESDEGPNDEDDEPSASGSCASISEDDKWHKEFKEWQENQGNQKKKQQSGRDTVEDALKNLLYNGGVPETEAPDKKKRKKKDEKKITPQTANDFREDADSTKYNLPYDPSQFVPFMFWTTVMIAKTVAQAAVDYLSPLLYRCIRFVVNFRLQGQKTTSYQTDPEPPHDLLWGVYLKSSVSAFHTRAAETKPELVLQDITILAMNGFFEKSTFMRLSDEAAQKNYKHPNKAEISWPKGFLPKDRVLQTLKLMRERARMNSSKHYLWFGFRDENRFKKLVTALRPLRSEVEGKSSIIGEDPQSGDTSITKKILEEYHFDEVMKVMPYACTDLHQDGSQAAQAFHQEVAEQVRTGMLAVPYEEQRNKYTGPFRILDELLKLPKDCPASTVTTGMSTWWLLVRNFKPKGKGSKGDQGGDGSTYRQGGGSWKKGGKGKGKKGKGKKGKGKKGKGGKGREEEYHEENWDDHWNSWEKETREKKLKKREAEEEVVRDPKKKKYGDDDKTPFRKMQERLIEQVHSKTGIPTAKLSEAFASKDYCPIHGAQIAKVEGKKNKEGKTQEWKCVRGKDCWRETIEHLRLRYREERSKRYQREKARLDSIFADLEPFRQSPESKKIQQEYEDMKLQSVRLINQRYVDHDQQFGTQCLNSWIWGQLGQWSGYLNQQKRAILWGKRGYVQRGFPTQGLAPIYGCWEQGRQLTEVEKARYEEARSEERTLSTILEGYTKFRSGPYAMEDEEIQKRSYEAVEKMMDGVLGKFVPFSQIDEKKFLTPFFGIGQKRMPDGTWAKVRPIANEKDRNRATSPISEHLALPGIPEIIDGIYCCMNPGYLDPHAQSKKDVIDSIEKNRVKKAGGKLAWTNVSALPKPHPGYSGTAFVPSLGKIDLFQACLQMGVDDPTQNQIQIWSPGEQEMKYGVLNSMTFGNVHSVFGFVAAVSEPLNHFINRILGIPAYVYIDDIIFYGASECIGLYADSVRRLCALLGLAVAPEKTETASYGQTLEILGIEFTPHEDRCVIDLPLKKKQLIAEKVEALLALIKSDDTVKANFNSIRPELERIDGLFIHALFSRKHKRNIPATRFIYDLLAEDAEDFRKSIFGKKSRTTLSMMLKKINRTVQEAEPYVIQIRAATRGRHHMMTDASKDKSDKVALGGLVWLDESKCIGYSIHLNQNELPATMRGQSIMSYELIAVTLAQRLLRKHIDTTHVICHCDNAGAVFAIEAQARSYGLQIQPKVDQELKHMGATNNYHNDPKRALDRNSKWRTWMLYTRQFRPDLHWEPDNYEKDHQVQWLKQNHPDVWLIDCEYKYPQHYMSLVGQRLRSLNVLESKNPHAAAMMTQTFERVKKLVVEASAMKAHPPDLTRIANLNQREKKIFAMWQQCGLRPNSMISIRKDMVEHREESNYVKIKVPEIKIDAKPGEMFEVVIPKAVYKPEVLPISRNDLIKIAKELGTSTYGPRRGLAIWCRLLACEHGLTPNSTNPVTKQRFQDLKTEVGQHFGWLPKSNMWIDEYAVDAFQWINTSFAIHPLMAHRFRVAAQERTMPDGAGEGSSGAGRNKKKLPPVPQFRLEEH